MKKLFTLRKGNGRGTVAILLSVLLLLSTFALGVGANALKTAWNSYIDMTPEGLYTLTDTFVQEVSRIKDKDITITFCADPDILLSHYETRYVYIMAREIEKAFSNVTVVTHNIADDPTAVQEFRTTSSTVIDWNHVIVSSEKRYRMLKADAFWTTDVTTNEYFAFNGEYRMATAMLSITAIDCPAAYFTVEHGERVYNPEEPEDPENERYRAFWQLLQDAGLTVKTLDLDKEPMIPDDCALLVMNAPTRDYAVTKDEIFSVGATSAIEKIDRYLDRAGSLMVFKDSDVTLPTLEEFLAEWGIAYVNGVTVKDARPDTGSQPTTEADLKKLIAVYPDSEKDALGHSLYSDVAGLSTAPRMIVANSGYLVSTWLEDTKWISNGVSAMTSAFLYSSPDSRAFSLADGGITNEDGSYSLARVTTRVLADEVRDYYSYVFCAAGTEMIETAYLENATYANYDVLFATVRSISRTDEYASDALGGLNMNSQKYGGKHLQSEEIYSVDTPVYENGEVVRVYYALTLGAAIAYAIVIFLPPVVLLVVGSVRCVRRKYR